MLAERNGLSCILYRVRKWCHQSQCTRPLYAVLSDKVGRVHKLYLCRRGIHFGEIALRDMFCILHKLSFRYLHNRLFDMYFLFHRIPYIFGNLSLAHLCSHCYYTSLFYRFHIYCMLCL
jgi:hypothetical protein